MALFTRTKKYNVTSKEEGKSFKIVFFGDSLINLPYRNFKLAEKIQLQFPKVKLEFVNAGINGNHIEHMLARLQTDVLDHNPDAVIILWDSDLCEDIETLGKEEVKQQFEANVRQVLNQIKERVPLVALSGPAILGEPGSLFNVKRYEGKDPFLDLYRDINRRVCSELEVPYIDIRDAYQKAIPFYWPFQRWYLTTDGEHPNETGTQIEADLFAPVINQWLSH